MMLEPISWTTYIFTTSGALLLYYMVLLFMYRKQLLQRVQQNTTFKTEILKPVEHPPFSEIDTKTVERKPSKETDRLNSLVHELVDEIEAYTMAVGEDEDKKQVIRGLSAILQKYHTLQQSHLRESIDDLISVSCESNCNLLLSESEISVLWQKEGQS